MDADVSFVLFCFVLKSVLFVIGISDSVKIDRS